MCALAFVGGKAWTLIIETLLNFPAGHAFNPIEALLLGIVLWHPLSPPQ